MLFVVYFSIMQYSLAKELKDMGFPQEYHDCMGDRDGNCVCCNERWEKDVMKPTLSELIDACEPNIDGINKTAPERGSMKARWIATGSPYQMDSMTESIKELGKTPEIAVAKLYLALHRKERLQNAIGGAVKALSKK